MDYEELVGNDILVLVTVCLLNSTTSQLLRADRIPLPERRKEKKRKEKKRKEKKRKEKKRKENGKPNKTE
jgi:hypothetical protein